MKQFLTQLTVVFGLLLVSSSSFAQADFAIAVGTRINNGDTDLNASVESKTGLQVGGELFLPMNDIWWFRTGFLYTERFVGLNTNPKVDVKFTYLDIPVTFMYKYTDFAGFFAGPVLGLIQSKAVEASGGNTLTGVSGTIVPIQIGVFFKFHPNLGGEFVYEHLGSKLADGLTGMRSIGGNLLITFE